MKDPRRKTIGLVINQLEARYQEMVWPGVFDIARERDANLFVFMGRSLEAPVNQEWVQNFVYDYPSPENVDGLVIISGVIGNFVSPEKLHAFCHQFVGIPKVALGVRVEGIPSVVIDNKEGMRSLVQHFVEHGYRRIAFVRGPENNQEAELRFEAYKEVLSENGIPYDDAIVAPGNFVYYSGNAAVRLLFDERKVDVDAIVAANDEMLTGVYAELKERGIHVPEAIALGGFDDIEDMKSQVPPVTTVAQPLYDLAKKATTLLLDQIEGRAVPDEVSLPAKLIVRQSCGCNELLSTPRKNSNDAPSVSSDLEELFVHLETLRNDLYRAALQQNVSVSDRRKQGLSDLITAFYTDMKRDAKPEAFALLFLALVKEDLRDEIEIDFWGTVIDSLRRSLVPYFQSTVDGTIKSDYVFQVAKNILNEGLSLKYKNNWAETRNTLWVGRRVSVELGTTFDMSKLNDVLMRTLQIVHIKHCFLYLFYPEKSIVKRLQGEKKFRSKKNGYAFFALQDGKQYAIESENVKTNLTHLVPPWLPPTDERQELLICALALNTERYGIAVFDIGSREAATYELFREQIGLAIKGALLTQEREQAQSKLVQALNELNLANSKLQGLSQTDELTGLFNRRGFVALGLQHYQHALRKNEDFAIFFADLDGLKKINDTYGHKEGDFAIRSAAVILRRTFRQSDILARLGGDEFVVLAADTSPEYFSKIYERLEAELEAFNRQSEKPFRVAMSLGGISLRENLGCTFYELMEKADRKLYQEKEERARKGLRQQR